MEFTDLPLDSERIILHQIEILFKRFQFLSLK